jgi:hypothetical protein
MYLDKKLDEFIDVLKSSDELAQVKIIKAYPYAIKPTRPSKTIVGVYAGKIDMQSVSVGGDELYGSYELKADVFVPQGCDSSAVSQVIAGILNAVANDTISAVSVSQISSDDSISSLTATCTLTYTAGR